jgi:H+/Cl- antiporter ClcA
MPIAISDRLLFLAKWALIVLVVGIGSGSASAFFLTALEWAGRTREANLWLVGLLPLGGFLIGLSYYYLGRDVEKGNNQIIEEYYRPDKPIPFKMAPLVLFTTIATHLFGGSAGREGTAVQMGAAIADRFSKWFPLSKAEHRVLLMLGISGGFASVFGTPLAGTVFALEVLIIGRMRWKAIPAVAITAYLADFVCHAWQVGHTEYSIYQVPELTWLFAAYAAVAGIIFGLGSKLFTLGMETFGGLFRRYVKFPPLRPVIGGALLAVAFLSLGSTKYMGLGIPTILASFEGPLPSYDFLAKILFTTFTLAAGFKGGEVTPLFFIGATLGNALAWILPLPISLLAGMGFVGLFAGATQTPIACFLMGIELFGWEAWPYLLIACMFGYFSSGYSTIYGEQRLKGQKWKWLGDLKGKNSNH